MREALLSLHTYCPDDSQSKSVCELDHCAIHQLLLTNSDIHQFDITFDWALERLAQLGAHVEPDGSFTQGGRQNEQSWSLGGMLYDEGSRLAYADFAGKAPTNVWLDMFGALQDTDAGQNLHRPVVYLKAEGIFAEVEDFIAWLKQVQLETP